MATQPPVDSSNVISPRLISIRAADLLALGKPFVEFPRYSILDLRRKFGVSDAADGFVNLDNNHDDISVIDNRSKDFADWLSQRLQAGHPFVIQDFEKLPQWNREILSIEGLIEHSTKKNISIRNCTTGRDLNFTLKKFADVARQSYKEFKTLYARDLPCPEAWLDLCRKVLPPELQWAGRSDLFQWLPPCARSEVMMAYVGSEGSSSGFHRCFSSTVALNLLIEGSEHPVLCFGTDFESQIKYDSFMVSRGASPHFDWLNLGPDELKHADFPLYVHEQKEGDLVVFPPATAHQVWNLGSISTKVVWNILHPLSLEAGLVHVQLPFNRLCHPDVARSNLSLACAMLSLLRDDPKVPIPPHLELLTRLFRQMVKDESISDPPITQIALVRVPETAIVTCNFCSTAIWNRHLRCCECEDFDLCMPCYLGGRSCEHIQSYSWAEIVPEETCLRVLTRAQQILGYQLGESHGSEHRKPLGQSVNELMYAKKKAIGRLCHLCRIDHLEWKGRRCDRCSAFFCFRGLYRHFDLNSSDVIRQAGPWICPKCLEVCNCRCCHFSSAYVKSEKPASKRRVKPADARGKVMGFTDNVFDQKKRNMSISASASSLSSKGQKRPFSTFSGLQNSLHGSEYVPTLARTPNIHGCGAVSIPNERSSPRMRDERGSVNTSKVPDGSPQVNSHSQDDAKVLHSIEYITRMPSPSTNHVPLPPLNLECALERKVDLSLSPESKRSSTNTAQRTNGDPRPITNFDDGKTDTSNQRNLPSTSPYLTFTTSSTFPATNFCPATTGNASTNSTSATTSTIPTSTTSISSATSTSPSCPDLAHLESQLYRLNKYAEELLSLSLHDSFHLLKQEIGIMENKIHLAKMERGKELLRALDSEFPNLTSVREGIRREGSRLGYF